MSSAATAENDVFVLLKLLWAARTSILIGWLVFLPLSFITLHLLPRTYTASAEIAPPAGAAGTGTLSKLGGLGGLGAALSNVAGDMSSESGNNFPALLESFSSHELSNILQQKYNLLQMIYADRWDSERHNWAPPSFLSRTLSGIKYIVTGQPSRNIDTYKLDDFLAGHLSYDQIQQTPFYVVTYTYGNRADAERTLSRILASADSIVRAAHLVRAEEQIKYLEGKLQQVTIEQHKQVLSNLLLEQERTAMLAQSRSSFAFEFVRTVSSSPTPTSPNPLLVIGLFTLLGTLAGLGIHSAKNWFGRPDLHNRVGQPTYSH
jgi:LPS O-antigen subunit length determinant protein (WzzB/FepE family)